MEHHEKYSVEQWYLSLTAGVIFLLLGAGVFFYPSNSYNKLTTIFIGGFGMVGLLELFYALNNRKQLNYWGWTLMCGLMDLTITFLLLTTDRLDAIGLAVYIGFVLLFRSIIGVGFSSYLVNYKVRNWGWVLTLSLMGILFSIMMIWETRIGILNLTLNTTLALLSVGFAQIGIAYELKKFDDQRKAKKA